MGLLSWLMNYAAAEFESSIWISTWELPTRQYG